MDIHATTPALMQFLQSLRQKLTVEEVIVFGSYLDGLATEESDIDVLVISSDFAALDEDNRLDILDAAAEGIVPDVHPWGFTPDELRKASRLTTVGYAREEGIRVPVA